MDESAHWNLSPNTMIRQIRLKKTLQLRAAIVQEIRNYFISSDYLEVETPHRIPAPAPESHIDAEPSGDWYLHPSPELCMKRLLAAGYGRIFQICRCFRSHERGRRHLPELTMLEWYTAGHDYRDVMDQCETLIGRLQRQIGDSGAISYQGRRIDLQTPWDRMTVAEAFERYASISMWQALADNRFDEVLGLKIEPRLGGSRPVFLFDYPAQCGSLARLKPDNPRLAERFELYIGGLELCNAYSELTDAVEQRRRFARARTQRNLVGKRSYPMPELFLQQLSHMPPAAGNALGIDRLVMLFADAADIDAVVAFTPEEL